MSETEKRKSGGEILAQAASEYIEAHYKEKFSAEDLLPLCGNEAQKIHIDRTSCRYCHYRHFGCDAATCPEQGAGKSRGHFLHIQ